MRARAIVGARGARLKPGAMTRARVAHTICAVNVRRAAAALECRGPTCVRFLALKTFDTCEVLIAPDIYG